MADRRGLGQTGRTGGVDIESRIPNRWRAIFPVARRLASALLDLEIDPQQAVTAFTVRPASDPGVKPWQYRGKGGEQIGADNDVLGRNDADRALERGANQIGVDQRDNCADAGYPKPDR